VNQTEEINKKLWGNQVCFVNSKEPPIKTRHICYYTEEAHCEGVLYLCLIQVIEETYRHPQAPEDATVSRIIARHVKSEPVNQAAEIGLLHNAQQVVRTIHKLETP